MINLIKDIDKWCEETIIEKRHLPEITSSSIKQSNGVYDPNGLFSNEFFGQEMSTTWKTMYARIKIPHPVIHPAIYYMIKRNVSYLLKWIKLEIGFAQEDNNLILTNASSSYTFCGITDLVKYGKGLCKQLRNTGKFDTKTANAILRAIENEESFVFTSNVIVAPPAFRENDDDNKVLIKIIDEINVLKSAMGSNNKMLINRILISIQDYYSMLYDEMIAKIKGKEGLVRGQMLGKSVDFSARGVIVPDPMLKPSQLGIPRKMLIKLFYPWIIHYIVSHKEVSNYLAKLKVAPNIPNLYSLINTQMFEKRMDSNIVQIINKVMEEVIKDKVIIAKRDPVLHKLSVRGFYPIPVDDSSIHICPLVCSGFNADFDGDQMAIFVPLTNKTQNLVKENLLTTKTLYHPGGDLSFELSMDYVFAIYMMTKDNMPTNKDPEVLPDNTDIIDILFNKTDDFSKPITFKSRTNTIGRRIIELLYNDHIKVEEAFTKKKINDQLKFIGENYNNELEDVMYRLLRVGATVSSFIGGTNSIKDYDIGEELKKKRDEIINNPDKYDVDTEIDNILKEFLDKTEKNNQLPTLFTLSGAKGKKENIKQISIAKGYVADTSGKVLPKPIGSCFADGFTPTDYFISSYGNRKGVIDRSQNTAQSGYLQRQMIYLAAPVKCGEVKDCGTDHFLNIILLEEYVDMLEGRVLKNGDILTKDYVKENNLIGKMISVYSPLYCKADDLCHKCYPDYYRKFNPNSSNVGLISANVVGERGSQLIIEIYSKLI